MTSNTVDNVTERAVKPPDTDSTGTTRQRATHDSRPVDGRMRAVIHSRYGPPSVLKVQDVERPRPDTDQVLVRVRAASVNAAEKHLMRGKPFLVRLMGSGIRRPKRPQFGADVAGVVEAVGSDVTSFQPGDAVFGDLSGSGLGSFAEFVCADEAMLASLPDGVDFETAAAAPVAAVTALQGLRDHGRIQEGDRVLINGASGGVGSFAVQIAKAYGATVTGVCRTEKVEAVRSIGADDVVDYTEVNYAETGERYDLILDVGAHQSVFASRRALASGGRYVLAGGALGPTMQALVLGPLLSRLGSKHTTGFMLSPNRADLDVVAELIASGDIAPLVDRQFTLEEVPEAIAYLEAGRATGKVVITVE